MRLPNSRLTDRQTNDLLKLFVSGATARVAAELVGVNRNTATALFRKVRGAIARHQEREQEAAFDGPVEVDESYFGAPRRGGKRGRGAPGKVPVFGILRRGGRVYTQMIADVKRETLMPIIKRKVAPDSVVYSDTLNSYDSLTVEGYQHVRINHDEHWATEGGTHINGIENFLRQAKRHLRKFNGVPRTSFHLCLKECEWRFNGGSPKKLLISLRKILQTEQTS